MIIKLYAEQNTRQQWSHKGRLVMNKITIKFNNQSYDETITIIKDNIISIIVKTEYKVEIYAKGVGLIYKEDKVLDYDINNPGIIVEGIEFSQKLIETGEEI